MPLTVITIKKVPRSLRGDLTKWMQEIATGVYVGNFNSRVREKLWKRVKESVQDGEATLTYAYRNELGYLFDTINSDREVIDYDGLPLVMLPLKEPTDEKVKLGFSNAAKFRKAQRYQGSYNKKVEERKTVGSGYHSCVFIDIETDGLDEDENFIIELGAYKPSEDKGFTYLIKTKRELPSAIIELTGITNDLLNSEGVSEELALREFVEFIGDYDLVGYNIDFDIRFINNKLKRYGISQLKNKRYDLLKFVKREKRFLGNYKLQSVIREYGIEEDVPHRALSDAKLIYSLSNKVNKFRDLLEKE